MSLRALCCLALLMLSAASARAGNSATETVRQDSLTIVSNAIGAESKSVTLDSRALAELPRERVAAVDHGTPGNWEGVGMLQLLRKVGAPLDQSLRGAHLASYVLVTAADGYQVVFALAEFDPAFGASAAILADTRDDAPLNEHEGPFRIIVADEKRSGRWIRQVVRIEVISARTEVDRNPSGQRSHADD